MHSGNRFDEDIFETGMVLEQNANTWELTKLQDFFLLRSSLMTGILQQGLPL